VNDSSELVRFYERAYSRDAAEAQRYSRWRALGARGKADHVVALCAQARLHPASVLEVGCGDGALLAELHARGFAATLDGVEISEAAVAIARRRRGVGSVELYDGHRLPHGEGAYELGILSHVLEHVPDPAGLLREVARACRAVAVEVPLERNWSARRASRRRRSEEVGHLQRLDRAAAREIVKGAGLRIAAELEDPLPLRAHTFFAVTPAERAAAGARWASRRALHGIARPLARRAFTLHYACLCLPPAA
jgi:SAM-dependent methyltransferase